MQFASTPLGVMTACATLGSLEMDLCAQVCFHRANNNSSNNYYAKKYVTLKVLNIGKVPITL